MNLRRILTVVLCVLMLFGMVNAAEVKPFSDIPADTKLSEAVNELSQKDIISGFEDGTFKPDQSITRAEFAAIISRFIGSGDIANTTTLSGFPDVDNVGGQEHWAKKYILVAKSGGIIVGYDDGSFKPDAPVTYEQAVKMIMCARGYQGLAYPDGYMTLAITKGVLKNSTHKGANNDSAIRGTIAIMVFNALSLESATKSAIPIEDGGGSFVLPSTGGSGGSGGGGGGGSSGTETRTFSGIVRGTYRTYLNTSITDLYENEIEIYDDKTGTYEVLPLSSSYKPNNLLGMYITASIKEDNRGDDYIYSLKYNTTKMKKDVYVDLKDFISVKDGVVKYYDDNDNVQSLILAGSPDLIYNCKAAINKFKESDLTNVRQGSFRFVSNTGKSEINLIFINSYRTVVVNNKTTSNNLNLIKCKYGAADVDVTTRLREVTMTDSSNADYPFSSLKAYDVLNVLESEDGTIVDVKVSTDKKSGEVLSINTSEGTIQIGTSGTYKYSYNYREYTGTDKVTPQEGDNITVYLSIEGKIAAMVKTTSSNPEYYAYLVEAGTDSGTFANDSDPVGVKLYNVGDSSYTGIIKYLNTKVKIDGVTYDKQATAVMNALEDSAALINDTKDPDLNTNTKYAQLIRYEMNGSLITSIDTVKEGNGNADDNKLTLDTKYKYDDVNGTDGKSTFNTSTPYGFVLGANKFYVSTSIPTKVIFVPGDRVGDANLYSTKTYSSSNFISGLKYRVEAYNVNSNGYASYMIQYIDDPKSDFTAYSKAGIVNSVSKTIVDNKITVTLNYYDTNGAIKSVVVSDNMVDNPRVMLLKKGSMIRFTEDLESKLLDFKYVLDINNLPIESVNSIEEAKSQRLTEIELYDDIATAEGRDARFRTQYGTVQSYSDSLNELYLNPFVRADNVDDINTGIELYTGIKDSTVKTFVFTAGSGSAEGTLEVLTSTAHQDRLSELLSIENDGIDNADQIMIYSSKSSIKFIYIIIDPEQQNVQ